MPSVDFYFIAPEGPEARLLFACRLLEKAYLQQHQIYVQVEDAQKAQYLNNLLWTFRDESFIPHSLQESVETAAAPIQIGYSQQAPAHQDILLNLSSEIPSFHETFKRILEVIPNGQEQETKAEEHREFYDQKGYKITTHQLSSKRSHHG